MGRVVVSLEVPGLSVSYDGDAGLFDREVRPLMQGVASGSWRARGALVAAPGGPAGPDPVERDGEGPSGSPAPSVGALAGPGGRVPGDPPADAAAPPPPAVAEPASDRGFDFRPLLRTLGQDRGRRGEREAVLTALAGLAAEGRRDATPAEVVEWLEGKGFPARDLKPRPILAKLCHRKGLAVPGVARNSFRATPAGAAHVARLLRGE